VHVYIEYVCFIFASCLLHRVNGVLVSDELTDGQAVLHYSRHRLKAIFITAIRRQWPTWLRSRTRQPGQNWL